MGGPHVKITSEVSPPPSVSGPVSVALISLTATSQVKENWSNGLAAIETAADQGAQWVQLPEMWTYMGDYSRLADVAEPDGGSRLEKLREIALKRKIVLFTGTLIESTLPIKKDQKFFNTLYVIGRDGEIWGKYRKTHLFNLLGPDGSKSHCESDGYDAGNQPAVIDIDGLKVALSVCYDLRFGEYYYRLLNDHGPFDVLAAPSAFTYQTGLVHWELLLRARAVEFQSYVYATNQVGYHDPQKNPQKRSFGHGMLVGPWGEVLCSTGSGVGIALGIIDKCKIQEVRAMLPVLMNRRPELYGRR